MTEQMGTPGSTADTSVNGGKAGAPKDKSCPFCHQAFTSSSLGRHLDLYIKEKNPKAVDGIHHVEEIRKLRGGITRRQPRNSTSKREDSIPAGTPASQERRSPPPEQEMSGTRSPNQRRESGAMVMFENNRKPNFQINQATWEATGVMNNIPVTRNGGSLHSWDGEEREGTRRPEGKNRSVSRQMLAKTTFEQKQKMTDALDNARAAELALREILGALRAAKQRVDGLPIFDYDPLSLDFPALTLHCLLPPPTLYQSTPIANSKSWSILPPDDEQYQALRAHFSLEFHRWRVSCAVATTAPRDDLSYPLPPQPEFPNLDDPVEVAQRAEAKAAELETQLYDHLHKMFTHWTSLSSQKRSEVWTLELARNVGRKSEEIQRLKKEKELSHQETAHWKLQVDELSRLQYPREFKMSPPSTLPVESKFMNEAGEIGLNYRGIGWSLIDRSVQIDTAIERAIGRWKGVVKEARGAGPNLAGMAGQRSLNGESSTPIQTQISFQNHIQSPTQQRHPHHLSPRKRNPLSNPSANSNVNSSTNHTMTNDTDDVGSDQDADADMEEDNSFVEMTDVGHGRAPEPQMAQAASFRLSNGVNEQRNPSVDGLENQTCVAGYVRIGA